MYGKSDELLEACPMGAWVVDGCTFSFSCIHFEKVDSVSNSSPQQRLVSEDATTRG